MNKKKTKIIHVHFFSGHKNYYFGSVTATLTYLHIQGNRLHGSLSSSSAHGGRQSLHQRPGLDNKVCAT